MLAGADIEKLQQCLKILLKKVLFYSIAKKWNHYIQTKYYFCFGKVKTTGWLASFGYEFSNKKNISKSQKTKNSWILI